MEDIELRSMLREAIEEELHAISLYEEYAQKTDNQRAAMVLQEVADDEKHHIADFLEVLEDIDDVQADELEKIANLAETIGKPTLGTGGSIGGLLLGGEAGKRIDNVTNLDTPVGETAGGLVGLLLGGEIGEGLSEEIPGANELATLGLAAGGAELGTEIGEVAGIDKRLAALGGGLLAPGIMYAGGKLGKEKYKDDVRSKGR